MIGASLEIYRSVSPGSMGLIVSVSGSHFLDGSRHVSFDLLGRFVGETGSDAVHDFEPSPPFRNQFFAHLNGNHGRQHIWSKSWNCGSLLHVTLLGCTDAGGATLGRLWLLPRPPAAAAQGRIGLIAIRGDRDSGNAAGARSRPAKTKVSVRLERGDPMPHFFFGDQAVDENLNW